MYKDKSVRIDNMKNTVIYGIFCMIMLIALGILAYCVIYRTGWESQLMCVALASACFMVIKDADDE